MEAALNYWLRSILLTFGGAIYHETERKTFFLALVELDCFSGPYILSVSGPNIPVAICPTGCFIPFWETYCCAISGAPPTQMT